MNNEGMGVKMEIMTDKFGICVIENDNSFRFRQMMDVDTFGTLIVKAASLDEAVLRVNALCDNSKACWKS